MAAYLTVDELRAYNKDPGSLNQSVYEDAIAAAQIEIDAMCGRFFSADQTVSTAFYWPTTFSQCPIDDLYDTTGLLVAVDFSGDGTYSQSWTLNTDFFLEPVNQVSGGIRGYPYTSLQATFTSKFFPLRQTFLYMRPTVRVTGLFGWAAVPTPVKQATAIVANKLAKMGEAPFGVAGFDQWGTIRVGNIPEVRNLLGPYMLDQYAVA